MKCYKCNAIIDKEDALFCSKCGSEIFAEEQTDLESLDSEGLDSEGLDSEGLDWDNMDSEDSDFAASEIPHEYKSSQSPVEELSDEHFVMAEKKHADFNYVYEESDTTENDADKRNIEKKDKKSGGYAPFYYAGFFSRCCALFIDLFAMTIVLGYMVSKNPSDSAVGWATIGLQIVFFPLFESMFKGSPGKIIMRIKVVLDSSHTKISFKRALMRNILKILSIVTIIGIFWPLLNKKKQALHDYITKCVLIRN